MANEVVIRLEVPYEEIKRIINITPEDLEKRYNPMIQKELSDFLSYNQDSNLVIERYYQVCTILSNIKVYNWKVSNNINPKEGKQINLMGIMENEFEKILKKVNAYFLRSTDALNKKEFDIEKDFILYYNYNMNHNDWGN